MKYLLPNRTPASQILTNYTIPKGSTYEHEFTGLNDFSALILTVKVTYDANATKGVRTRWLYSPDGINYDSVEDAELEGNYSDISFEAGKTRQKTFIIPILQNFIKIQIVNLDTTYDVLVNVWFSLLR